MVLAKSFSWSLLWSLGVNPEENDYKTIWNNSGLSYKYSGVRLMIKSMTKLYFANYLSIIDNLWTFLISLQIICESYVKTFLKILFFPGYHDQFIAVFPHLLHQYFKLTIWFVLVPINSLKVYFNECAINTQQGKILATGVYRIEKFFIKLMIPIIRE